jgi:hypothetical protein
MFLPGGGGIESAVIKLPCPMSTPPIRIHAADQAQADAVWRALCEQTAITEAEVWLGGAYLFHVVRRGGGMLTTLREAPQARTPLPVVVEAA